MKLFLIPLFIILLTASGNAQSYQILNENLLPHQFKSWLGKWSIEHPRFNKYDSSTRLMEAQVWYNAESNFIIINRSAHSYKADNDFNIDMKTYISFDSSRNMFLMSSIEHSQLSSEAIQFLPDGSFFYEYQQPFGKRFRVTHKVVGDRWYTEREALQLDKKWELEVVSFMNKVD